jgi:integrase
VRRVAYEAADSGFLSPEAAAGIRRVKGVRCIGVRIGNWLSAEEGKRLLQAAQVNTRRGKRDFAMLALLVGCGLRRGELLGLDCESIQLREEHWVIADLVGKAGHIRTVPIPSWVKGAVDEWLEVSGIKEGCVFRAINKVGKVSGNGMTPKVIWEMVRRSARQVRNRKFSASRSQADLRTSVSLGRWRTGANSVLTWARLDSDDRALSRV